MVAPVRYTPQKQQERISRGQLCERLDEFGWIATPPDEDLGEDFIVHIYLQRRATGVTFHLQLKSITNLNERRKDDFLVYAFEVKDLKHWEAFSLPVVLMVWDIELREGRWALVDDVISDLDRRRPNWRDKKSKVRVYIPWNNTSDDAGLIRLRYKIGKRVYPLIAKGKQLIKHVALDIPDTPEGRLAKVAFERFLKEGEQFICDGKFISVLAQDEILSLWTGGIDPNTIEVIFGPRVPPKTFPIVIYLISKDGELTSIPNVELKATSAGYELAKLSNEHQKSLLHFRLTYQRPNAYKLEVKFNNLMHDVCTIRNIMKFFQVTGGMVRLTFSDLEDNHLDFNISTHPSEKISNPQTLQLIDKLCTIQKKIGKPLSIRPFGEYVDIQEVDKFLSIIEQGKAIRRLSEITKKFKKEGLETILNIHRQGKLIYLGHTENESYVELLDQKIPTGGMTQYTIGTINISANELEKVIAELSQDEYVSTKFFDVEIIEIFPDWFIREAQRLSQLLAEKFEIETIYLFGSLVWSDIHTPETDIDLAVSDLPETRFLEAVSYLERESKFPIDLIDLSKASDHLRQRILVEGKLLYEREPIAAFS